MKPEILFAIGYWRFNPSRVLNSNINIDLAAYHYCYVTVSLKDLNILLEFTWSSLCRLSVKGVMLLPQHVLLPELFQLFQESLPRLK